MATSDVDEPPRPEAMRALVRHGYDPSAMPSGVSGTPTVWRGADGVLLRAHVCYLDGIKVDGHEELDPSERDSPCIHCDHPWEGHKMIAPREEAAAQMMELGRAYPPLMQIAGDLLAKNLDWPGADDIAERLKAMLPPQVQGKNPQAAQMQQQMQMMDAQAKQAIGQLTQQLQQLQQKLSAEQNSQQADMLRLEIDKKKLEIDAYNAETNRLKVTQTDQQRIQELIVETVQQLIGSHEPQQIGAADGSTQQ